MFTFIQLAVYAILYELFEALLSISINLFVPFLCMTFHPGA